MLKENRVYKKVHTYIYIYVKCSCQLFLNKVKRRKKSILLLCTFNARVFKIAWLLNSIQKNSLQLESTSIIHIFLFQRYAQILHNQKDEEKLGSGSFGYVTRGKGPNGLEYVRKTVISSDDQSHFKGKLYNEIELMWHQAIKLEWIKDLILIIL